MSSFFRSLINRLDRKYSASPDIRPLRHPINALIILSQIAKVCSMLKPILSVDYFKLFWRAAKLCRRERFLPYEAYAVGLLSHDVSPSEADKYLSRKKLTKLQRSVNPE